MKLAILGGGGFRVPLVYGALLGDRHRPRVDLVHLHDVDGARVTAIGHVVRQLAEAAPGGLGDAPAVRTTSDLDEALDGADFVFSAIRVGGLRGRVADERVALELGLLGQETTGPGGLAYGLRTVPVAVAVAQRVRALAPDAWVINFTNPAGMITEAMQRVLGERVVGVCDSPVGLARRAAQLLDRDLPGTGIDYAGLNHLGWLHALHAEGTDVLPDLLARPELLLQLEEARIFGVDWLQSLGAIPNEYLYYYYFTREAVASVKGSGRTRGEFLLDQQHAFYAAVAARPELAGRDWERVRRERNATYMSEARGDETVRAGPGRGPAAGGTARAGAEVAGGGYEGVALALMGAIARGEEASLILNVRNGCALPGLPPDAVVEVPCTVDRDGPAPLPVSPLTGHQLGLVQQVKAVERLAIDAAISRSARLAVQAFALHPLVDSVSTARVLLEGYRERTPELAALFGVRAGEPPRGRSSSG